MCGIVGVVGAREVQEILLTGLERLEYRGYDSAGVATLENGALHRTRRLGKVAALREALMEAPTAGRIGIAHTRWATHGVPSEKNAHPHMSGDGLALVHNGIIENHEALRRELQGLGYVFDSETDTETVVHLIHHTYAACGDLREAVRQAVQRLEGAYGLVVLHRDHPDELIAARQGSPLVVGVGIGEMYLASDPLALRPVTDRFVFMEEGDLVVVRREGFEVFSVDDETQVRATVRIEMAEEDTDKRGYAHHMLKEIHQQPKVATATLEGRISKDQVLEGAFGVGAKAIFDEAQAVTLVACGTSFYAASVARYWIEALAGLPCSVEIASEFRYRTVAVAPKTLFVTLSQSGETADTLAALRLAKERGYLALLTLCNVPTSTMVREADLALMLEAGTEVGVASTKAFTAMLIDLLLLALCLGRRKGLPAEEERAIVEALHGLPAQIKHTLEVLEQPVRALAQAFVPHSNALFLGRGEMYPIALEGALKLKEISYIHAEGYPAGELKHGPLALVDEHMPVVAVAPNDELLEKLESNLQEVRARGGQLYVFADEDTPFEPEPGVEVVPVPRCPALLAPIIHTLPLQLLAYYVAVLRGTDVDQPRNLAKSVTVE